MSIKYNNIRLRRGTASEWAASEPQPGGEVLKLGEPGYEKDTGKLKIGDGTTPWNNLPYFNDGASLDSEAVQDLMGYGFLLAGSGININYDDENNNLTISTSGNYSIDGHSHETFDSAVEWTPYHSYIQNDEKSRYLAGDLVYYSGMLYKAKFDNESLPVSNSTYWQVVGSGYRLNIDGRDIERIPYPVTSVNGQTGDVIINISGDNLTLEQVDDRVSQLLIAGTGINLNYDDVNNSLIISSSGINQNNSQEVYVYGSGLHSIQPKNGKNIASGDYSNITGGKDAVASLYGEEAHSAGKFLKAGDSQIRKFVLRNSTDGLTTIINGQTFYPLLLDGGDSNTLNHRITIPSDCTWFYTIKVIARQDNTGYSAAYEFKGTLKVYELYGASLMPYMETILYEDEPDWHVYIRTFGNTLDIYARVPDVSSGVVYWVAYVEAVQVIAPPPPDVPPPPPSSSSSSSLSISSSSSSSSSSNSLSLSNSSSTDSVSLSSST